MEHSSGSFNRYERNWFQQDRNLFLPLQIASGRQPEANLGAMASGPQGFPFVIPIPYRAALTVLRRACHVSTGPTVQQPEGSEERRGKRRRGCIRSFHSHPIS